MMLVALYCIFYYLPPAVAIYLPNIYSFSHQVIRELKILPLRDYHLGTLRNVEVPQACAPLRQILEIPVPDAAAARETKVPQRGAPTSQGTHAFSRDSAAPGEH